MTALFDPDFHPVDARALAARLKALADPTRLLILRQLRHEGLATNGDLQEALCVAQPTMSHHLRILAAAGLITSRKEGVFVIRELDAAALEDLARLINPAVRL
ncbi:ArsR/SmtB family transcription factor [Actinoplanes lobatus]|uniref:Transcriptional regulator n=1 Tax=Actinoplanes lobatus TaxID=113568 RepID=A0A7W7MMG1_9ACTN|nr:metalloregulator ArsR/SmtB family transcription factor [Actinoplanes lobatus]MBB4755326.1 ArsR family transcriptional regulator [Actinoplanes lobatus]GIE46384.1 transcriptional regulator [Actinoplanes lobatus]